MAHTTLGRALTREETIRRSRFVTHLAPVDAVAAAERVVAERRRLHPGASHHPFALRLGADVRQSDDGEPGGTAGRPMLEVLLKRDLDHLVAVTSRYFGGVKLGAGGLARAYAGGVAKALDGAELRRVDDLVSVHLETPFEATDAVFRLLDGWEGLQRGDSVYSARGVGVDARLRADELERLERALQDASRGAARLRVRAEEDPPP